MAGYTIISALSRSGIARVSAAGRICLSLMVAVPIRTQEPSGYFGIFRRYIGVPLTQVGSLRIRWLRDRTYNSSDPLRGVIWTVGTNTAQTGQGYLSEVTERIGRIRTDLDAFSDQEILILENQGYLAADLRIQQTLTELVPTPKPKLTVPHPQMLDTRRVKTFLKYSDRRVPLLGRWRFGSQFRA